MEKQHDASFISRVILDQENPFLKKGFFIYNFIYQSELKTKITKKGPKTKIKGNNNIVNNNIILGSVVIILTEQSLNEKDLDIEKKLSEIVPKIISDESK